MRLRIPGLRMPRITSLTATARHRKPRTARMPRTASLTASARHRMPRKRAPARLPRIAVLTASAWVAAVAVLAGLLVAGASSRVVATAAPGSSARAAASAVVSDVVARPAGLQTARSAHVIRARQRQAARAAAVSWTVRPGQTLSGIAGSWCGAPADWTGLYAANKSVIGPDPNLIQPGQQYSRGCYQSRAPPARAASSSSRHGSGWGVSYGNPYYCGDGDGDGFDVTCASIGRGGPASATAGTQPRESAARPGDPPGSGSGWGHHRRHHYYSSSSSYHGSGSYEQCVIARESGGNSQVMNSSGHYGLYQFSASTWQAYGGSAGDFGHASVGEQRRVFDNAMAQGGQSNWSPYDGC
jgi:transglycosylase-like protein